MSSNAGNKAASHRFAYKSGPRLASMQVQKALHSASECMPFLLQCDNFIINIMGTEYPCHAHLGPAEI